MLSDRIEIRLGTVVVARKRNQTVDDIVGVVSVQARGISHEGVASLRTTERAASGLVEEQNRWTSYKFACDRDTALLSSRDRAMTFKTSISL
jgi:hypothetical protein